MTQVVIPLNVDASESLVRGVVQPFFYSDRQKKLKLEAFMPPPKKADVSVLRLEYTTPSFCKGHCKGLRINNSDYVGMAVLTAEAVNIASQLSNTGFSVNVVATPLDAALQLVTKVPITTADPGLPMHADIMYHAVPDVVQGVPNSNMKLIARQLLKYCCYYPDPTPALSNWGGSSLLPPQAQFEAA